MDPPAVRSLRDASGHGFAPLGEGGELLYTASSYAIPLEIDPPEGNR